MEKNDISRKLIAVVGPTASGKTSLGVFLAKKFGGEIISADSRQVYKGLDIGTGKDLSEYNGIKYHLIDICDPGKKFTLFDYLNYARFVIDDIFGRGKLPVVVGGTGLYVQALTQGFELEQVKSLKFKVKSYRREELAKMSLLKLQGIVRKLKAESCKLEAVDINNPHRLIRFIEKAQSGVIPSKKKPDFEVLQIGINLPREELYQKIDQRVESWFREGIVEEIKDLINNGVDSKWLLDLGLEYRIIGNYILENPKSKIQNPKSKKLEAESYKLFSDMKQELKYKIHQFAKRQLTWFGRFPEIKWVKNKKEAEILLKKYL